MDELTTKKRLSTIKTNNVKVKVKETKGLEPIELTITIESQEEFDDLYARIAVNDEAINGYIHNTSGCKANLTGCYSLWEELNILKK